MKLIFYISLVVAGHKPDVLQDLLGNPKFQKAVERKLDGNTKIVFPFEQTEEEFRFTQKGIILNLQQRMKFMDDQKERYEELERTTDKILERVTDRYNELREKIEDVKEKLKSLS